MAYFKKVSPKVNFPALEEEVLKYWKENNTFKKSIEKREKNDEFVFYDGPPFATGLPHYGHLMVSILKDVFPRYKTMKGFKVDRRWGWDCHGLPIENLAEKELGLGNHQDIMNYGLDKFCESCRSNVFKYTDEWEIIINRIGRWVDFGNQYKTLDPNYMESVWWVFKELYDKGLIYEGYKVLPYCFRCHTPLSTFETRVDDAYRMKQDRTVTAKLKLEEGENEYLLIWTTTPWTLPSNMATAVGAEMDYVKILDKASSEKYILAKARLSAYYKEESEYEIVTEMKGKDLVGKKYLPLFDYFEKSSQFEEQKEKRRFEVLAGDFVTTEDGTGIVHIAPAFGEDDFNLAKLHEIAFFLPVDDKGDFTKDVPDFAEKNVFEANAEVIQLLKDKKVLIHQSTIDHSYPHCWRCDTPLIYKAVTAWFVKIDPIKEKMIANNQLINWVPEHVKNGSFGKWLEGARDWCISRNRYWGAVLPVWKCDKCDHKKVFGGKEELEKLTGENINDLHRHFVDKYTFKCEKCSEGTMSRIPEVLDCWFESGAMPYAQVHYPFENKEWFESHFPADFITEYIGQTRGWFYTLLVLSTGLFDKPAFLNSVVHGVILAEDGRKMSKRLKNYPDPMELVNKYGADALRLALLMSPNVSGDDIKFSDSLVDNAMKKVILAYWNSYSFFTTYANIDDWSPEKSNLKVEHELDSWILAKLEALIENVNQKMDVYHVQKASESFASFMDDLNNWYIRRSRRRFWKSSNDNDKNFAYSTLYHVLVTVAKLLAPFIPFTADSAFQGLTKGESVHLEDWPLENHDLRNPAVEKKMDLMRNIVNIALALRSKQGVKVRQPLSLMTFAIPSHVQVELLEDDLAVIREEVNVKKLEFVSDYREIADVQLVVNAKVLGPRVGGKVQQIIMATKKGEFELSESGVKVLDEVLQDGEYEVSYKGKDGDNVGSCSSAVIKLDLTITPELKAEGFARDIVRLIQEQRKAKDFNVDDKIVTNLFLSNGDLRDAVLANKEMIMEETLSAEFLLTDNQTGHITDIDGEVVGIDLRVV